jgi:hypothetical protein
MLNEAKEETKESEERLQKMRNALTQQFDIASKEAAAQIAQRKVLFFIGFSFCL